MTLRIVLLGPPGAGKGSQATKLSAEKGLAHISTGNIFRAAVSEGTEIGLKVKGILDAGGLVPDELTVALVRERLLEEDCKAGFLLDGFPRTLGQAEALDQMLREINAPLSHVIDIVVPEDILLSRIENRIAAGEARSDDSAEVLAKRIAVYKSQTAPISDYYRKQDRLNEIDGVGTIDEVRERIESIL